MISAVLLGAAVLATVAPGPAGATLVFTRNPFHPAVFAAQDNGKGVHRIGAGYSPHVSPDGRSVVYYGGKGSEMVVAPAAGGRSRTLLSNWREPFTFAFSPDSKLVAALRGHELGKQKLVVIDVATGRQHPIADGFFSGLSFSPDSSELVFSRSGRAYSISGDLFRASVDGGSPRAITHDHRSIRPLWGPRGRIVFDRVRNLKSQFGPKGDLYLINPDGSGVKRLTRTKISPCSSASTRCSGRRTATACSPSSAARTPATRSPSTRATAPNARWSRGTSSRASSVRRSPRTAGSCSARPAARNPAPTTTSR